MKKSKILLILPILLLIFLLIPKRNIVEKYIEAEKKEELFGSYYQEASKIMSSMTLEEKVGQLFFARYPLNPDEEILNENPGGYILFARDFKKETKESILAKINTNQEKSKIKMFFGVDEEGGAVVRISKFTQFRDNPFAYPQELFATGGFDSVLADLDEKIELLKSVGINTNFAPVIDLPTKDSSYIYKRSFGLNVENTVKYASLSVKKMNDSKMLSVLKHFPGYGDNINTHTGVAIDNRTLEYLKDNDLKPFVAGINEKAPIILVNHNIIMDVDDKYPASLSRKVHDILREDLNFNGLIITDDLNMDAIKEYTENKTAAVQAILAGNDMIVSSDFVNQKKEILEAINNNIIEESLINKAVQRILACKLAYGII